MKKELKSTVTRIALFMAMMLLVMVAVFSAKADFPANAIWVEPQEYNATAEGKTAGDQFTVSVWINVSGLYGFEYKLQWNDTLINCTDHTYYLPEVWGDDYFIAKDDVTAGQYWFGVTAIGADTPTFNGSMKILDITFEIVYQPYLPEENMSCALDLVDTKLGDPDANPIPHTVYDGQYSIEALPPMSITDVVQSPSAEVQPTDIVKVNATVTSINPIENVTLYYSTDNGTTWNERPMTNLSGDIYNTTIPALDAGTYVIYKIVAFDEAGNMAVEDNAGDYYVYTVIPEFTTLAALILIITVTATTLILAKRRKLRIQKNN